MNDRAYWFRQDTEKPIFPDLVWSRPEHKAQAGKLLIVGGNAHGFVDPAEAYGHAIKAGAGSIRVMLPDAVHRLAGAVLPEVEFAPSTPSGSFGQQATAEIVAASAWADGILLVGNFGQNSETAVLLESIASKHTGQLTVAKDAVEILLSGNAPLPESNRLYVVTMAQLQKLAIKLKVTQPITSTMDLLLLVDALHELTTSHELAIIARHLNQYIIAVGGKVSTTKLSSPPKKWLLSTATQATVWWLQNPSKTFEALTTSVIVH